MREPRTTKPDHSMRLSAAEAEVIHLLRGRTAPAFCLTVTSLRGAWTVKLATVPTATVSENVGQSFNEAWRGHPVPAALQAGPRRFGVVEGGK